MVYARKTGEKVLTFDFALGLLDDNLLIVDRETSSVWSQLHGKAISGPLDGTPLEIVPSIQTTWAHWRRLHPDTVVAVIEGEEGRPYLYRTWRPGDPRPATRPTTHDTSTLGLGLVVADEAIFFLLDELSGAPTLPLQIVVGGEPVVIHYESEAPTAWAETPGGQLLSGVLVYESGWRRFFPQTRVFTAPGS